MTNGTDRLERLLDHDDITGIDFVYVHDDQVTLDVFFHHWPDAVFPSLVDDLDSSAIRIAGVLGDLPEIPLSEEPDDAPEWMDADDPPFLRLTAAHPGGFSLYRLFIDDPRIDPYFNGVTFSFKAACESDLDCRPQAHECPPEEEVDFPVDYQARDFWSLRRALLDFAAERYPEWPDRLEADAGVMMAEVMSALGDELAYYQDRIGREAFLETASQRRSLRRHARLVDYEIHDGLAASTWIDVTAADGASGDLPAGTDVWAESDGGSRAYYEVGRGLADIAEGVAFAVHADLNSLRPHIWDEDDTCLPVGSTELDVLGRHDDKIDLEDTPEGSAPGKWMLLKTNPECADMPVRRWRVRVIRVEPLTDPLVGEGETGREITRLVWEAAQALPFELDMTVLEVRGNMVPATSGRTYAGTFVIGADPDDPGLGLPEEGQLTLTRAVERQGRLVEGRTPEECTVYLYSLTGSDEAPLCRVGDDPRKATPEIQLRPVRWDAGWIPADSEMVGWEWRASLLGAFASQPNDPHFTIEDGTWRRVVGYQRIGRETVHRDYAGGNGATVRFGDGEFGRVPERGTIFEVTYRLGNGRRGNVAADSLVRFDADATPSFVAAITNPFAAEDGLDPETPDEVRRLAPDAFRAVTYRAVRPEDYAEAAERLPWVQRANASFRWTGSWTTVFVTPDPRGATSVSPAQRRELVEQIDRFRQAGRQAHMAEPRYADLDLVITICVEPFAYRGEVKARVMEVLVGKPGHSGFFSPDNFTFGTPLRRSRIEAAIQGVAGVRAVEGIEMRRRGVFDWRPLTGPHYPVGDGEVIRVDNDPNHPGHGSLKLEMRGGA